MEIFNYTITILSLIGASLAWIAKLKWSKEFKEAKNAEIKAKIAQMDAIREKVNLYESVISNKLIDYSKQTISELEALLIKTEKSKQEEINKILNKIKENEEAFKLKHPVSENIPLISNLIHEIKTPINAIVGSTELLRLDDLTKKERDEFLKIAAISAKKLISVTDDLSQMISTMQPINKNKTGLN